MTTDIFRPANTGALMETFVLPPSQNGVLDGLTFTVKDNIDIAGRRTCYGSKAWGQSHADATCHAVCVEQLLAAGATCIGRAVADESTYSLAGENPFFGTPLNPKAPDRVPGGSSSGSASSVACGLADFSLGTDSAGSIRVPASFCGVFGIRPTLHRISEAGVLPFMPSVSTVGAFASTGDVLENVMRVLLSSAEVAPPGIRTLYMLEDAFALADPVVQTAFRDSTASLGQTLGVTVVPVTIHDMFGDDIDLITCNERALRCLQTAEFANTVGAWIETTKPDLSPGFVMAYQNVLGFDRSTLTDALRLREHLFRQMSGFIGPGDVVCFPTTPTLPPLKASLADAETVQQFYNRTMAVTSFAGVGRLPELSVPLARSEGIPVGVSFAAGPYQDETLLNIAKRFLP